MSKDVLEENIAYYEVTNTGRLKYKRTSYNRAPSDFIRLTANYSLEETQKILEAAEIGVFLVFAKVIWPDETESYESLTPTEVTVIRNHSDQGYNTSVIISSFETNITQLWVSGIFANKFIEHAKEKAEWIAKAKIYADEEAKKLSETTGMLKISGKLISSKVAARFEKEKIYGVNGFPLDKEYIRRHALTGWRFNKNKLSKLSKPRN